MDFRKTLCALLLLVIYLHLAECMNNGKINFREKEKQILDQILGPGRYDARIRPSGLNGTGFLGKFREPGIPGIKLYRLRFDPDAVDTQLYTLTMMGT